MRNRPAKVDLDLNNFPIQHGQDLRIAELTTIKLGALIRDKYLVPIRE